MTGRLLITGALGHIGSHLIRRIPDLLPATELILVDVLPSRGHVSLQNLPSRLKYSIHEKDVRDGDLTPLLQNVSAVIHLAAITDAAASHERREEVESTNIEGTRRIARAAHEARVPLLFASTTSIYGPQDGEVDEECSMADINPQSVYAESKLRAEELIIEEAASDREERDSDREEEASDRLKFAIFRMGTIFGPSPGMRFHTAVNRFCRQAVAGEPLEVWKTAIGQKRPYLGVDDAVRAIIHAVERGLFDNRVYNVVSVNAALIEVIDEIKRHVPSTAIREVEHPIMNQLSYSVSASRFKLTGFEYRDRLSEGIARTIEHIESRANPDAIL